jgi:hypothetical protein
LSHVRDSSSSFLIWLHRAGRQKRADGTSRCVTLALRSSADPSRPIGPTALEQHFREKPSVFVKFDADRGSATAFVATKNAPVVFSR